MAKRPSEKGGWSPKYLDDLPSETPQFDFELAAEALAHIFATPGKAARVLGLHGDWGVGKTTMMRAVRKKLEAFHSSASPSEKYIFIEFNAWKFQDREALWRALILLMLAELEVRGASTDKLQELKDSLYRAFEVEENGPWRVNWRSAITEVIGLGLQVVRLDLVAGAVRSSSSWLGRLFVGKGERKEEGDDGLAGTFDDERIERLGKLIERKVVERHVEQVRSVEQFLDTFRGLIEDFTADGRRIFVLIDDLDRCLPESALEIFEAIKLFLDAPGVGYVVALDRGVIRKGLAVRYARSGEAVAGQRLIDPDEYIEKTISVSYDLPRLGTPDIDRLIDTASLPIALDDKHRQAIMAALGPNPRRIKRFLNTLALQLHLGRIVAREKTVPAWLLAEEPDTQFRSFLKLLLLSYRFPGAAAVFLADTALLDRFEGASRLYITEVRKDAGEARKERRRVLEGESALLATLEHEEDFWRLLAQHPLLAKEPAVLAEARDWFRAHAPAPYL